MPYTKPRLLRGFRDHFGPAMEQRQRVLDKIRAVLNSYGFQPLETPALEYQDIISPHSDQSEKLFYGFTDHGRREVALKYDLTVPTARFAAMNWETLPQPFRRYQNQSVWRADRPGAGRYREFQQFDFDTYGSASVLYDAEILLVIEECLRTLEFDQFTIRLNDRRVLTGLLQGAGIEPDRHVAALRSLDKLNKIGVEGVRQELEAGSFAPVIVNRLLSFLMEIDGLSSESLLPQLEAHFRANEINVGREGVDALLTILKTVAAAGMRRGVVQLWPVLARGLDYYTGPIHEVIVHDAAVGSVCGGGRYDHLFEKFSERSVPATGTSLGIERLLDVLSGSNGFENGSPTKVLICATDQVGMVAGLQLSRQIREVGLSAEVYLDNASLKKQLRYADLRRIPLVVLMPRSGDEVTDHIIVKDMQTGQQESVTPLCLANYIADTLRQKRGDK